MLIEVTQEHINSGICEDPTCCPIALAIQPKIEGTCFVLLESIEIEHNNRSKFIRMPEFAQKFVRDFDGLGQVKPFSLELDIPEELIRKI